MDRTFNYTVKVSTPAYTDTAGVSVEIPGAGIDMASFYLGQLEARRKTIAWETYRTQKASLNKLKRFRPGVKIHEITTAFLMDYENFLHGLGNDTNTVHKNIRDLRTYFNRARARGLVEPNHRPWDMFRMRLKPTLPRFLTANEMHALLDCYYGQAMGVHKRILKCFLFCCLTGLAYGDIYRLRPEHIRDNMLVLQRTKTKEPFIVPLVAAAKQFLPDKPEGMDGEIFQVYTNQAYNRYLKDVQEMCGLSRKLTTHVARHTFATTAISAGMPLQVVADIMGITQLRTAQIYARVADPLKIKEMEKLNRMFRAIQNACL